MRTTRKEIEGVFNLWVNSINGRIAKSYNDTGAYRLDYAACYGGYRVERICNASGGVSDIFNTRLPAWEFVTALRYAMRTLEEARLEHVAHCPSMQDVDNGCAHFTAAGVSK